MKNLTITRTKLKEICKPYLVDSPVYADKKAWEKLDSITEINIGGVARENSTRPGCILEQVSGQKGSYDLPTACILDSVIKIELGIDDIEPHGNIPNITIIELKGN